MCRHDELSWSFTDKFRATRCMKVKRMGITEILRSIWLFSTNKIKNSESGSKQPTQCIIKLNLSLQHIIDTKYFLYFFSWPQTPKNLWIKIIERKCPKVRFYRLTWELVRTFSSIYGKATWNGILLPKLFWPTVRKIVLVISKILKILGLQPRILKVLRSLFGNKIPFQVTLP